ncbi:hypothetical protein Syun_023589 [Stephania yunnanensis]|uniref:Uncharacterized protein n=1 Tax=Stephania yunnanensis TaxID=152371 RepID=A0AAP0HZR8_9MAGN
MKVEFLGGIDLSQRCSYEFGREPHGMCEFANEKRQQCDPESLENPSVPLWEKSGTRRAKMAKEGVSQLIEEGQCGRGDG